MVSFGGKTQYCLYRRSNGFWYVSITKNGRRIQKTTNAKSKTKALEFVAKLQDEDLEIVTKTKTIEVFSRGVFDYESGPIVRRKKLRGFSYSKSYADTNQHYVDDYIVPYFGKVQVGDLSANDVEWWLLTIPERHGVGAKTANSVLGALRAVLAEAQLQGLITSNPAASVKPLSKNLGSKRRGCFTVEQVKDIFKDKWNNLAYSACMLAATTGMRMGEVRALTVEQIHDGYIDVDASWNDQEGRKCTKSGWGRIVPLSSDMKAVLDEIMPPCGLVFSLNGVKPVGDKVISKRLYERLEDIGLDYRELNLSFHSFRHYFNTRLIAAGIQGEKVRAILGHESEQMTEHYMHLSAEDMSEIRKIQHFAV